MEVVGRRVGEVGFIKARTEQQVYGERPNSVRLRCHVNASYGRPSIHMCSSAGPNKRRP